MKYLSNKTHRLAVVVMILLAAEIIYGTYYIILSTQKNLEQIKIDDKKAACYKRISILMQIYHKPLNGGYYCDPKYRERKAAEEAEYKKVLQEEIKSGRYAINMRKQ